MTIKLYQFPVSHYCEKIRWALDYKKIPFRKINLIPGPHASRILSMAEKSEVPVIDDDGIIVQGSDAIIDYLDAKFPEYPLTPADPILAEQARQWEERLDLVAGRGVRAFFYHYLLPYPSVIVPLLTVKQSPVVKLLFYIGYQKMSKTMRNWMDINEATVHKSMSDMDKLLSELRQSYMNTRYLVGNEFSRADLTACALFAPLFQPHGYGLKWPTLASAPAEMKEWLDSHEGALSSLAMRYEQNR
ncbi:MAG: glutathione S-transferase family protein [Thalassolituus sp.]